ncbi:MAG TPA: DinB family protein [Roseiflexaceae bacterium]|nr:DinB family protein [Roseiflexaceae bacterium]
MQAQGDTTVLTRLFAHNAWANQKLLDFCAGLSDEQLDATAIGCYGTIRATLQHIIRAETRYVERASGKAWEVPLPPDQFSGFDTLREASRWANGELTLLAIAARKDTLVHDPPPHPPAAYPLASLIVQSITHSTEHRTQIASIITQLGMEPPDMSGWCYMDEMGEIQE